MLTRLPGTQEFTDPRGWNQDYYYSTLRLVVCCGELYLCGRGSDACYMEKLEANAGEWVALGTHSEMVDAGGWLNKCYYATIRVAVIGDKIYSFARGTNEIHFLTYSIVRNTWVNRPFPWLQDAGGWRDPKYYETIRVCVRNTQLLVAARGTRELHIGQYDSALEHWSFLAGPQWMTDAQGFDQPQFYTTFNIHGFPQGLYFFTRSPRGAQVAYMTLTDQKFVLIPPMELFEGSNGWDEPRHYRTIQATAYSGKWYFTGKGRTSIELACFDTDIEQWSIFPSNSNIMSVFIDAPHCYETFRTEVVSDKLVVFARGNGPAVFVNFNLRTGNWEEAVVRDWLSEGKYNAHGYYSTIQTAAIGDKMYVCMRGDQLVEVMCYQSPQTYTTN